MSLADGSSIAFADSGAARVVAHNHPSAETGVAEVVRQAGAEAVIKRVLAAGIGRPRGKPVHPPSVGSPASASDRYARY
jgi:hypothetical protein